MAKERVHVDVSALEVSEGTVADIERASYNRTSKYTPIVERAMKLTPNKGLTIKVPPGVEPANFRLNVANAVRNKVCGAWLNEGKEQTLRVFLGTSKTTGEQVVAVKCVSGSPAKLPRGKKKESKRAAKK